MEEVYPTVCISNHAPMECDICDAPNVIRSSFSCSCLSNLSPKKSSVSGRPAFLSSERCQYHESYIIHFSTSISLADISLFELFPRSQNPSQALVGPTAPTASTEAMTCTSRLPGQSPLLNLPLELRSQIYEYIIETRVVHVRMNWVGIFSPTGFSYSCFNDLQPLLDPPASDLLAKAVPFTSDITILNLVCRQMHQDTSLIPFKSWVWSFEDAFTLDLFVTAKRLSSIPIHHKEAIRRVAVAPPGPHRSHERVLQSLQEVLLIRSGDLPVENDQHNNISLPSRREVLRLRRDTLTDTWLRNE